MTEAPREPATSEHLRFRGLELVDQDTISFDFEGIGTEDRVFLATRSHADGITLINFDHEFNRLFLGVPCLNLGVPFIRLAGQVFAATDELLPVGAAWEAAFRNCVAAVDQRAAT